MFGVAIVSRYRAVSFKENKLFNSARFHDYNVHYLLPVTSGGDGH